MDMRKETVTIEEVTELSRRMTANAVRIQRMVRDGLGNMPICQKMMEQDARDSVELAMKLLHCLNDTIIGSMMMCSTTLPFIRAAFTMTADKLGELDESTKCRELHDELVRYMKKATELCTVAVRADVFEAMRAQAQDDEKKGTEEE